MAWHHLTDQYAPTLDKTFGIAIGTFGAANWKLKGEVLSLRVCNMADDVIAVHGETLAEARNLAAQMLPTKWVVFLDADDELKPDYIDQMRIAAEPNVLLQPATLGCVDGVYDDYPVVIPSRDLYKANYMVIGTAVERDRFFEVGGFRNLPALEDWDLWIRLVISGSVVKRVPFAVYVVHVSEDGRNQNVKAHAAAYRKIQREYALRRTILRNHTVY